MFTKENTALLQLNICISGTVLPNFCSLCSISHFVLKVKILHFLLPTHTTYRSTIAIVTIYSVRENCSSFLLIIYRIASNFRRTNISLIKFLDGYYFRNTCALRKLNLYKFYNAKKFRTCPINFM